MKISLVGTRGVPPGTAVSRPASSRSAFGWSRPGTRSSSTAASPGRTKSRYRPNTKACSWSAPFIPLLRARGIPVATHVDGLEWKRSKWQGAGRKYYRAAESMAVRWSDALIADAQGIADYYQDEFGADTELIAYGAPIVSDDRPDLLAEVGREPHGYHLVVARFEPETTSMSSSTGIGGATRSCP